MWQIIDLQNRIIQLTGGTRSPLTQVGGCRPEPDAQDLVSRCSRSANAAAQEVLLINKKRPPSEAQGYSRWYR